MVLRPICRLFWLLAAVNCLQGQLPQGDPFSSMCSGCLENADMAVGAIRSGLVTADFAISMAVKKCQEEAHLDAVFCQKVVGILVPMLVDLVKQSNFTGKDYCSIVITSCGEVHPLPSKNWSVPIPPEKIPPNIIGKLRATFKSLIEAAKTPKNLDEIRPMNPFYEFLSSLFFSGNNPKRELKKKKKKEDRLPSDYLKPRHPLRVLQLTDIHIDLEYSAGSAMHCAPPTAPAFIREFLICCRGPATKNKTDAAGFWGSTAGMCDLPHRTLVSALKFMRNNKMKFDYILLTGDYSPHDMWNYTKERSLHLFGNVSRTVRHFFPWTPVFHTLGNHEAVPFDSFSYKGPKNNSNDSVPQGWLYKELQEQIKIRIPENDRQEILKHGSYVSVPVAGLKIIHLNNNFCFEYNFFVHLSSQDPGGVLSFLVRELESAEAAGQAVHIHAHVPPSPLAGCLKDWSAVYLRILKRFRNTIREQFFGHNHVEHNLVYVDGNGEPLGTGWAAPSMTTWDHVNPAFRTYSIDRSSFKVTASSVFHADVENVPVSEEPRWQETDTLSLHGLSDFSGESWLEFFENLLGDPAARKKYRAALYRNSSYFYRKHPEVGEDRITEQVVYVE